MESTYNALLFFITIILVFDTIGFAVLLINLLFTASPRQFLATFVGALLVEAFILYIFWGFPPQCTAKVLFKTPVSVVYSVLYQTNNSQETPGPVKLISKPGEFVLKQFLSDKEEKFAEQYISRHPLDFVVNQVAYYVISCYKKYSLGTGGLSK